MTNLLRSTVALLVAFGAASLLRAAEIVPLSGKPVRGTVVGVDAQFVTFKDEASAELKVPIKEMSSIELGAKVPVLGDKPYDEIELTDGSLFRTAPGTAKFKLDKVEPGSLAGPEGAIAPTIVTPLNSMFVLLRDAHKPATRTEWKKLMGTRGKRDLFVLREKRETGEILQQSEGTLLTGNAEGDRVIFELTSGEKADYGLSRATGGIVFNQAPRAVVLPTVCKVMDVFGNVIIAASVEFAGSGLKVKSVSGAAVEYKALASVARLDFSQGNLAYLSEMDADVEAPKAVEGEPFFTYSKNKTAMGLPLRLDGKTYPKGLWIYPDTTLRYKLGGEYKTFRVVIGVDETVQIASSEVKVVIEGDGSVLFSKIVKRTDKPVEQTFNVKDVKELKITVERQSLYAGNQIDLGDARLQK